MTHRTFVDEQGRSWEVWEVHPEIVERRLNEDRRSVPRQTADRRQHVDIRFRMAPELRHGWLAFQSDVERRRLAPIPEGWERLNDEDLQLLVRTASPQPAAADYTPRTPTDREPQERR
jgi:hypothetical protein